MIPAVRSRLTRAVALSVLTVVPVAGTAPSSGATGDHTTGSRVTVAPADRTVPDVSLPRPVNGAAAVRQLGEQVDEAAARNDLAADELEHLLREDPTVWLDVDARVYYREPRLERSTSPGQLPSPGLPLADTFALHSHPAATRKIFLDFDGATVSGTAWHASKPLTPTEHPAWDPSGDGPTFNDSERQRVQAIWAAVAEDFAPFDVDVTTEDPGAAGIMRSGSSDTRYGSHALVSPSGALQSLCGGGCGGIAYLNVFGDTSAGAGGNGYGYRQPAWVFPQALGNDPKNIAEAVSHEVGHNLSLKHDGTNPTADDYYLGHGDWAPIMGAGYYRSVTQWSNGAYGGADNHEDDVAALVQRMGTRADEAGAGIAGAPTMPGGGLIATRADVDTYALGTCAGALSVAVDVAGTSPNLDARLQLLDGAGSVVAASDDPTRLSASLATSVASGPYYVSVDGVGRDTWLSNGYDDYGSLGRYDVTVDGDCGDTPPADETPSAPSGLSVAGTPTTSSVTVQWSAPADAGSSPVTGYAVSSSSGHTASLGGSTTSHTISGLQPGTSYTVEVAAVNDVGAGQAASVTVTTAPLPTARPGAPETLTAAWDPDAESGRLDWTPPLDDGGSPVTGYAVSLDGVALQTFPADTRAVTLTHVVPGRHVVGVAALNAVGTGRATTADLVVPKADSVTVLRAPRTARPGSRPVVRVTVTTDGEPARGLLVLTHRTGQRVLTLVDGATKLRLPRQQVGRNRVTATYHGDALTLTSLARKTIRVRRG